jgi:cell surface protein SprA
LVNIEDNSAFYQSPVPGNVLRQKDPNLPEQDVYSNEQSLSLDMRGILPGQSKVVFKSYVTRPLDLINYKILKLFVNGDTSLVYKTPEDYDASVIVRIGSDTSNYYEYRAPIHPDVRKPRENPMYTWNSLNEVVVNLSELTAVKQLQDSLGNIVYQDVPNGPPGSRYGVKGHPSIRDVKQITLGVYNNNTNPLVVRSLTGSIWFDEMRILKTNDASGYAFTVSAGLKLADLGTFNFSYSKTDPNFIILKNGSAH